MVTGIRYVKGDRLSQELRVGSDQIRSKKSKVCRELWEVQEIPLSEPDLERKYCK